MRPSVRDQPLAGFEQVITNGSWLHHIVKFFQIGLAQVDKVRAQKFMRLAR